MMIKTTIIFLTIMAVSCLLSACAEVKVAGHTIGHTTKNVTQDIGHGSRDTVKVLGKGTKRVVKSITQ
jgi:predicted small secreted protein